MTVSSKPHQANVEIEVTILSFSDAAVRVTVDEDEDGVWLPLSLVTIEDGRSTAEGERVTISAPEWLLIDKGLV